MTTMTAVDEEKLHAFVGQIVNDIGGACSVALVRIGDALGLYRTLLDHGPMTSAAFCERAGIAERYGREWLSHQAASNYIAYDPETKCFSLPPEQAMVFVDEDSPVYLMGAFDGVVAWANNQPLVEQAFRTGEGVGWGDQSGCLFCAVAKFFRPGYQANLVDHWLPSLDGVVDRLTDGGTVADVGCGHGYSTIIMAKAFPNARFIGYDFHPPSIAEARAHAEAHGVADRVRFEVCKAKEIPGAGYDLVTFFDCLHDMGDPVGACAHVRQALKPDGTLMIVEPMAGDTLEDNLNPVGRVYYGASTMVCVPTSLAQEVGTALGAQAGEGRLREVLSESGFTRFRRATETPFNMILEARP